MAPLRYPRECDGFAAERGIDHRYTLDCLSRHLQSTGWSGALELGHDPAAGDLVLAAGIGLLTVSASGVTFVPARAGTTPADQPKPLPAPPDLAERRLEACRACSSWSDRCSVAGCACAGLGIAERLHSRCPRGIWAS